MASFFQKIVVPTLCVSGHLFAATWTGATNDLWSDSGNWSGGIPNASGDQALFPSGIGAIPAVNLMGGAFTVGTLSITNDNAITIGAASTPVLQIEVSSGSGQMSFSGAGAHVIAANVILNSQMTLSQSATSGVTFSGSITGMAGLGFDKQGSQTVTLAGANVLTGASSVSSGTVIIEGVSSLSGGVTLSTGGTLEIETTTGNLDGSSGVAVNGGTFELEAGAVTKSIGTLSGTGGAINLNDNTLEITQASAQTVSSVISGTGSLIKLGSAALTLAGTNTYTGTTDVSVGTLILSNTDSIGTSGMLELADATILQLSTSEISEVLFSNDVVLGGSVTIDTDSRTLTLSGVVSELGGSLTKSGLGTLVLSEPNSYDGGTTGTAGTISVGDDLALGMEPLNLQGSNLRAAASVTLTNAITLTSDSSIETGANALVLSGVIDGAGDLTKLGSGSLELAVANVSYSGKIFLDAGTIIVGDALSLGSNELRMRGGELEAGGSFTMANAVILSSSGTVDTAGNSLELSGNISGSGGLTKTGTGTLTLFGTNSYQGESVINQGTLALFDNDSLGASSQITFEGTTPTLELLGNVTFSGTVFLDTNSTIDTGVNTLILNQGINGLGSALTKGGAGILQLNQNTALGDVIVNGGSIIFSAGIGLQIIGNLFGVGGTTLNFNDNTLRINQSANQTFAGTFSGTGQLVKEGGGTLTLSGDLTGFNSDLAVNNGTLNLMGSVTAIGSLSGSGGSVDFNAHTVTITQEKPGMFDGAIEGSGELTKEGAATLILEGTSGFSGTMNVAVGTLEVNGSLSSATLTVDAILTGSGLLGDTTVQSGGLVTGNGTYTSLSLESGGVATPLDLLTVTALYNQDSSSSLNISVMTLENSQVIAGTATIDGGSTLNVTVEGSCFKGETYDILTATAITGSWGTTNLPPECGFVLSSVMEGGFAIERLTATETVLFIGSVINKGNPSAVKSYLDCLRLTVADEGLVAIISAASVLDDAGLNAALNQLHPGLFGAFGLVSVDNNVLITKILAEQVSSQCAQVFQKEATSKGRVLQRGWFAPIGNFNAIEQYQQLRGYNANSGGILFGYDLYLPFSGVFGWSVGYYHTALSWKESASNASINSVLGGIYFGYAGKYLTIDMAIIGGENFYAVKRDIRFPGVFEQARNNHNGYFLAPRLGVETKVYSGEEGRVGLFGTLNYDQLWQRGYTEGGAPSLDLRVQKKRSEAVRTALGIKFSADIEIEGGCLSLFGSPSWVRKIPLGGGKYQSKLKDFSDRPCTLIVDTFDKKKDFVGLDFGFFYTFDAFTLTLVYRGEFSHDYLVNQIEGKWQCTF